MKASAAALFTLVLALSSASASHDASPASGMRRHHARKDAAKIHLEKRAPFSGDATFYHVETGNAGACGDYLKASDFVVALNQLQYGSLNAKSSWCGKTITISDGKKQTQARVEDACPTGGGNCGYGSLDMSLSLFQFFRSTDVGKFPITWWSGGGGGGIVVDDIVDAVTGGNKDDDNGWEEEQRKKKAAAKAKADAAAEKAREAEEEAAQSARASASKKAAKISASKASVSEAKASSSAAASRNRAKHFSMTKAAAASSSSETVATSRSEARVAASAATAQPTGNLNKFEALVKGLNKMVEEANA